MRTDGKRTTQGKENLMALTRPSRREALKFSSLVEELANENYPKCSTVFRVEMSESDILRISQTLSDTKQKC